VNLQSSKANKSIGVLKGQTEQKDTQELGYRVSNSTGKSHQKAGTSAKEGNL